jgi:hypothetical protein
MKTLFLFPICAFLLSGCATPVQSRKQERASDFAKLKPAEQLAAEGGRLAPGMSTTGAYVAWGKPSEVVSEAGVTTWLYRRPELKEHKSIVLQSPETVPGPQGITSILYPDPIVARTIVFENGLVKEWSLHPPSTLLKPINDPK